MNMNGVFFRVVFPVSTPPVMLVCISETLRIPTWQKTDIDSMLGLHLSLLTSIRATSFQLFFQQGVVDCSMLERADLSLQYIRYSCLLKCFRRRCMHHTFTNEFKTLNYCIYMRYRCTWTYIVPLDMKGCIFHFVKWQMHPFITKRDDIKAWFAGLYFARNTWNRPF